MGTRFGKVPFTRPVGRQLRRPKKPVDLPVDRDLGLAGGFSLGVMMAMTRLCAQMAFASARETFCEAYEWTPSPRATLRMVDTVGGEARAFLEQAPPPEDDGEILVVQVDGGGAPMISTAEFKRRRRPHRRAHVPGRRARRLRRRERPRRRRTKGKKSKNAKVAVVGVIYTLMQTPEGLEGPIGKRLYATFESHEALFIWLRWEADKQQGQTRATGRDHRALHQEPIGVGVRAGSEGCPSIDARHPFAGDLPAGTYYVRATTTDAGNLDYQLRVEVFR